MKKLVSALLTVSLLAGCGASSAAASAAETASAASTNETASASMTPGTYTATAHGMDGDVTVAVTVDESAITNIEIVDENETDSVGDKALGIVADEITENQSLAVDSVAGATISSAAMKTAVADALGQAGADAGEWKKREVAVETKDETFDYDVVVVGAGYAGIQSAFKAMQDGAKVALLEKQGIVGGTSIFSSGAYVAAFTEDEVDDKVQVWLDRNTQEVNTIDVDKLTTAMSNAPEIIQNYSDMGIQGKTFMETGWGIDATEKAQKNAASIKLATAEVHPKGGTNLIDTLVQKLQDGGVDIYLNTPASRLLTKDNAVVGVECDTKTGVKTFNAKAVVMATGTYARNAELCRQLDPSAEKNFTAASAGDTGEGIQMAVDAGAQFYPYQHKMSGIFAPDPYDMPVVGQPYNSYPYECLLVNSSAERPVKEDAGTHFQMEYFIEQDGPDYGWVVMDQNVADKFLNLDKYLKATEDGSTYIEAHKAGSVAELAKDMGVDADKLQATIDEYNKMCEAGEDTDLGKDPQYLTALTGDTWYAVKEYDMTRGEYGGIVTDDKAEVTDVDGNAIPGLYAAGLISSGDLIGDFYPGMEALGVCSYMGWISGREAAAYAAGN
ncbi:MAG: FAD-dependent oxidoreductase [Bulleidia sp.]|nr:FAD-dependent oxidoreductase [Bulleidia sp.]